MAIITNRVKKILKRRQFARVKFPKSIEYSYKNKLARLVNAWYKDYLRIVVPALSGIRSQIRTDAWDDDLAIVMGQYGTAVAGTIPVATTMTLEMAQRVNRWNKRQWLTQLEGALGSPVFTIEDVADVNKLAVEKNVEFVKKNSQTVVASTKTSILSGIEKGLSQKEINASVKRVAENALDNTNTLATMAVSSLNSQLYKARHKDMNISEYFWLTMNDAKVRSNHRPLHGMICRWDDPTVFKRSQNGKWLSRASIGAVMLEPGEDYNCRCQPAANMVNIGVQYE